MTRVPDPTRVDKGTATKEQSAHLSLYNRQRAEAELASSQKLREDIQVTEMNLYLILNDIDLFLSLSVEKNEQSAHLIFLARHLDVP